MSISVAYLTTLCDVVYIFSYNCFAQVVFVLV